MLTKVSSYKVLGDFRLHLTFNDGTCGVHDFASIVAEPGSMVRALSDPAYFSRVFLESGALTWPNGFDVAPEWLRREMADANEFEASAA